MNHNLWHIIYGSYSYYRIVTLVHGTLLYKRPRALSSLRAKQWNRIITGVEYTNNVYVQVPHETVCREIKRTCKVTFLGRSLRIQTI